MSADRRKFLLCNCEGTMAVDGGAIGAALAGEALPVHRQLCRADIVGFEAALAAGGPLVVACTQEAPLFSEIAEAADPPAGDIVFANIRERAGWCDGGPATAKMAALLAEAARPSAPARLKTIESDGLCLVYGRGQTALEAAQALRGRLSVTLVLAEADDVVLPSVLDIAVCRGRLAQIGGSLGRFEVTIDGYAPMLPSSRRQPEFLMPRDGARSRCSVIVDLSGGAPLVSGWRKRDGYLRADPADPAAVARLLLAAADLVGGFEKPIYVQYDAAICAHGRSRIKGCSKCLDHCPAGALMSGGDTIVVDEGICGGCGACASHCPTGAISYDYPRRADLVGRMQTLLAAYRAAGGAHPVLLVHDTGFGAEVINLLARLGPGLPPNVLPLALHSAAIPGHDGFAAALAAGAERVVVLTDPAKQEDYSAMALEAALTEAILSGFGDGAGGRILLLAERDPEAVAEKLWRLAPALAVATARFEPVGGKREVARTALGILHAAIAGAPAVVALPETAPYGRIAVDAGGCTLCLSCVSACPAGALLDNPDKPQLRFVEAACVQCGLCAKTCPEKVITLVPQLDMRETAMRPVTLHEDEPLPCIRCGRPFAARATVAKIRDRLAGRHWMFRSEAQSRLIEMCEDCRVKAQAEDGGPLAYGERPRMRTTDDYLEARARQLSVDDFLAGD